MPNASSDDSFGPLVRVVLLAAAIVVLVAIVMVTTLLWNGGPTPRPPSPSLPRPSASPPAPAAPPAAAARALALTAPPVAAAMSGDVDTGSDVDRSIEVVDGFRVECVYVVPETQGSWVSLTSDARGRLIAGDQSGGLYRITPAPSGAPSSATVVEPIDLPVGGAQGLLCVGDDLLCVVNGAFADGPGLYRLRDTDDDDLYDAYELLRAIPGDGGEHGRHGIVMGPDGMVYLVAGNHVRPPDLDGSCVPQVWDEDLLLPRLWDANGHAAGILAPGGWIARTNPDGASWELFAVGFRNPYDLAFNEAGELFTFDADMEWDMGAPWYRPTRVNHVTSGAEYGWRSGTGKWPAHYPDSLPAVIDIGPGSPTGVAFAYAAAFPARFRRALYLLDWTYGTVYAVHLRPRGATYEATREVFLTGRPLPLTDVVVNPADGAMYFTLGGRGVASALYRVRYTGEMEMATGPAPGVTVEARARRRLEAWHRADAPSEALDTIIPALGDDDRAIRYAARVALEHQPVDRWAKRVIAAPSPRVRLAGVLALTRVGLPARRADALSALSDLDWKSLDRDERLELLRCWSLAFIRMGPPGGTLAGELTRRFGAVFPTDDDTVDRELCDLLVYLQSPTIVAKTIPLMERARSSAAPIDEALLLRGDSYGQAILKIAAAPPQVQQVHYALALRNAERGWTADLRERYFRWFASAERTSGGNSFAGFLEAIRRDALDRLPEGERARYADVGRKPFVEVDADWLPRGPGRAWTVDEVVALAADGLHDRRYERGRQLFHAAACAACHRFAGTGRMGAADLTGAASRFAMRDLVEAIVEPSRVISDQQLQEEIVLDDDTILIGRVVREGDEALRVMPSLLMPDALVDVPKARIRSRRASDVSAMMPNLLDAMSEAEVLDLLAYLLSGGDPRSGMFR